MQGSDIYGYVTSRKGIM